MEEQMTFGQALKAEAEHAIEEHDAIRKVVANGAAPEELEARDARAEAVREALKDTPVFEAVWDTIKGWDIQRVFGEGYSGATGTDVGLILDAIRPFLALEQEQELSDPDKRELGPFVKDSSTSRKAALDNWPRQGSQRWRIIAALARAEDGLTRERIERNLGLSGNAVRPRVRELIDGGWVRETERERKTLTGSAAKVLELTDKGREEAEKRAVS